MAGDARRPPSARGCVCVIDAGTAITLDLLTADGAHLGGYILPGADLMSRALTNATGRINALADPPTWRRVTAHSVSVLVRGGPHGGSAVGIGRLSDHRPLLTGGAPTHSLNWGLRRRPALIWF